MSTALLWYRGSVHIILDPPGSLRASLAHLHLLIEVDNDASWRLCGMRDPPPARLKARRRARPVVTSTMGPYLLRNAVALLLQRHHDVRVRPRRIAYEHLLVLYMSFRGHACARVSP